MFTVIGYTEENRMTSLSFTTREEAMLYSQILYNSGDYKNVKVFDMAMCLIYSI